MTRALARSVEDARRERSQYLVYAALSVGIVGLTVLARFVDPLLFQRFTGEAADPIVVAIVISGLGAVVLSVLVNRQGFAIVRRGPARGLWRSTGLAALFGAIIIVADVAIVHPADMNVPFPESLLFYPVIGFMAEILFHVLPLWLLLMFLPTIFGTVRRETTIWASLLVVALVEPSFQTATAVLEAPVVGAPHTYSSWAVAYDGVHVFAINLCQLLIFRRYDFISMYAFRFV